MNEFMILQQIIIMRIIRIETNKVSCACDFVYMFAGQGGGEGGGGGGGGGGRLCMSVFSNLFFASPNSLSLSGLRVQEARQLPNGKKKKLDKLPS
jgi:hypothetical protein